MFDNFATKQSAMMVQIGEKKTSITQYDALLCGFLAGYTLGKDIDRNDIPKIAEQAIKLPFAKSIGITGTMKELLEEISLEK